MIENSPVTLALGGAIMALWLVVAGWAIVRGIMMQRSAAFAARRATQLAALLDGSPSMPLIVRADGRIEGPGAIAPLFGLETLPATVDGLSADGPLAIDAASMAQLQQDIVAAQRTGKSFNSLLRSAGGGRALRIRGLPAPQQMNASGAALLWITDASDAEARVVQLRHQREDAIAAFEAISSLIAGDAKMRVMLVSREFDVPAYPLGRRTAVCLPEDVSDTSFRIGFDHVLRDRAAITMN